VTNPDGAARRRSASFDPASGRYTLHVSSQSIHMPTATTPPARSAAEPKDVRFVAPDVGGGFGAKNFAYVEHALVAVGGAQGGPAGQVDREPQRGVPRPTMPPRDMQAEASLALDAAGPVSSRSRMASVANVGAYHGGQPSRAACRPIQYVHLQGTVYRICQRSRCMCAAVREQHRADRRDARAGLRGGGEQSSNG
jgi:carbon-monoxide dehydrogenase large subunit